MTTKTRAGAIAVGILLVWVILGALLPSGLPFGVILLGLVLGGLYGLTAMGLVLIYRSSRIINFAQVEIGALAATVAQVMVRGWHQSYVLAVIVGLAVALWARADSNARAMLRGTRGRRVSLITWVLAAGLSGVASTLAVPILGTDLGVIAGPVVLLPPLTAAVLARMESLPVAALGALGIGVFQQAVFWNYPNSSTVDVGLFAIIVGALLVQRRRISRVDDAGLGGYVAVREVRPIPAALRNLPEVRWGRTGLLAAVAVFTVLVPFTLSSGRVILLSYIALYGIIAISLVVLTGWSGQISLGQFAFVGIGAAVTASLLKSAGADFLVAMLVASVAGAAAAVLVGIPALRIQGLFLAVATL